MYSSCQRQGSGGEELKTNEDGKGSLEKRNSRCLSLRWELVFHPEWIAIPENILEMSDSGIGEIHVGNELMLRDRHLLLAKLAERNRPFTRYDSHVRN